MWRTGWVFETLDVMLGQAVYSHFQGNKMTFFLRQYWCTICTLDTENRVSIWGVGCDVGLSCFFAHQLSRWRIWNFRQDGCNVCTLDIENRMIIWSVGCDVGLSTFYSHVNFQGKGYGTFSPTTLMQCAYFGYGEQDDYFKRWMWCWVKPFFRTFKVEENEPSDPDTIQMRCVSTWVLLASKMKGT